MIPVLKTKWLGPYTSKEEASEAIKKEIPADADILRIKYKTFEYDSGISKEFYCKARYILPLPTKKEFLVAEAGYDVNGDINRYTREKAEQAALEKVPKDAYVFKITLIDRAPESPIREYWQAMVYYTFQI